MKTLVIGLPKSGKTTYVQQSPGKWIAYDLDYLAAAFRLMDPHEENDGAARRMANDLLCGFAANAELYSDNVFIIRTAPTPEEIADIQPDVMVVMRTAYDVERRDDFCADVARRNSRIEEAVSFARSCGCKIKTVTSPPPLPEKWAIGKPEEGSSF